MMESKKQSTEALDLQPIVRAMGMTLDDRARNGRRIDWGKRKMVSSYLASAYADIGDRRTAERVSCCGDHLIFGVDAAGHKHLRGANFCRARLCPICQWRRSLKLYGQMRRTLAWIEQHDPCRYIFLTLTRPNVTGDRLADTITEIQEACKRLLQYKQVRAAVRGTVRTTEVTHNVDPDSPSYDTYHPHIHLLIAVRPSYFTSRSYLSQQAWTDLWRAALGSLGSDAAQSPTLIVDVRKVKGKDAQAVADATRYNAIVTGPALPDGAALIPAGTAPEGGATCDLAGAVCEVTKYASKAKDYIILDDWDLTLDAVRTLDAALKGRRLVGHSGIFRQARAILRLEDSEEGDLIHVDPEEDPAADLYTVSYCWHTGYCEYRRSHVDAVKAGAAPLDLPGGCE